MKNSYKLLLLCFLFISLIFTSCDTGDTFRPIGAYSDNKNLYIDYFGNFVTGSFKLKVNDEKNYCNYTSVNDIFHNRLKIRFDGYTYNMDDDLKITCDYRNERDTFKVEDYDKESLKAADMYPPTEEIDVSGSFYPLKAYSEKGRIYVRYIGNYNYKKITVKGYVNDDEKITDITNHNSDRYLYVYLANYNYSAEDNINIVIYDGNIGKTFNLEVVNEE